VRHVLGSAAAHVAIDRPDRPRTLTFSGDLGRRDVRFLAAPDPLPAADVLVCESTYGDRRYAPFSETVGRLTAAVREAVYLGGKVLIPAFSLGRAQLIVHVLQQALRAGHIPAVPVFVDGLLAADIADVYREHLSCLTPEAADAVRAGRDILLRATGSC
jgi:metallo-beta-lactamase family protein